MPTQAEIHDIVDASRRAPGVAQKGVCRYRTRDEANADMERQAVETDAAMMRANATVADRNRLLDELEDRVADLERGLAREQAHRVGAWPRPSL